MDNKKILKEIEEYIKNPKSGENEGDEQYSFVALKPSQTNTTGAGVILESIAPTDFKIVYFGPAIYTEKNVQTHYKEIFDGYVADPNGKFKFYPELLEYLTRGPIYGFIIKGKNAVKGVKAICGATKNPAPGTMRYELFKILDIPYDINENGIHASGEVDEAKREIANFISAALVFPKDNPSMDNITNFIKNYKTSEANER